MGYPHYGADRQCVDSLEPLLAVQHAWSQRTFGTAPRPEGVLDHIRRELVEIEADPSDIVEWIDVALLALDGALRQCGDPARVANALLTKARLNREREWPPLSEQDPLRATEHVEVTTFDGTTTTLVNA